MDSLQSDAAFGPASPPRQFAPSLAAQQPQQQQQYLASPEKVGGGGSGGGGDGGGGAGSLTVCSPCISEPVM
jgi:hypothetical protein